MTSGEPSRRLEEVLEQGEFARLLLETVTQPVLVLDDQLNVLLISPACCDTLDVERAEVVGTQLFETNLALFDIPRLRTLLEKELLESDDVRDVEFSHPFRTVGERTLLVNARRVPEHGLIILALEDVTERRVRERELAESTEQFRILVDNVREYAIFTMDEGTRITTWNPGAERILGWTESDVIGRSGAIIFTPEDRERGVPEAELATAERNGQALDDRWHLRKDGSRFWASGVMVVLRDNGNVRGYAKILRDNTRRKKAETAIEESHHWLRRILEATPDIVAMYDIAEDRVGFVSPHLISDLGYEAEEFTHIDREAIGRIMHPDDRAMAAGVRRVLQEGGTGVPRDVSVRVFDANGRQRWFDARIVPFRFDDTGTLREVLVVARDFTEIRETQEELQRLMETLERRVDERTAQVRALASTLTMAEQQERRRISQVLHDDLQQRLYGIQMKLASVRNSADAGSSERLQRDAREAEKWLRDAIELTRDLTVELSPPVLRGEGLADALHWLVEQMERMYGLHVRLKSPHSFAIEDEDMRVLLFQIIREVLFNVVKHAGVEEATVVLWQEEKNLIVRIRDEGVGFDPGAAAAGPSDRPFGLFSVKERLRLFGGDMQIHSEPGSGTTVEIRVRSVLGPR